METQKADAAGSGTRDWFSIMQRLVSSLFDPAKFRRRQIKPAGLLHYYMPASKAVCTTQKGKNYSDRSLTRVAL
jgi:hypothetical protein